MIRKPVVADRFYPGNPGELAEFLGEVMDSAPEAEKQKALAIVSPHAGYVYSGGVAARTVGKVQVPETVVILGPNHSGRGAALALGVDNWSMPLGTVPVARELATKILDRSSVIVHDEIAHLGEHSLEVQVPFLQHVQANLAIVPIVVSHLSYALCQEAAADITQAIQEVGKPVLLVASTDMTHYESRTEAAVKDRMALEKLEQLDPEGLYETVLGNRISMCGVMPTVISLLTAMKLGAKKVDLIQYTDSGAVSGDIKQVVGYAGLVIS